MFSIIYYQLIEAIPNLQKGDILGHEFCGIIASVGPAVKNVKVGDRVVASFQIGCGDCYYCKKKLSSMCERTNSSEDAYKLYGRQTAGMTPFQIPMTTFKRLSY